MHIFEIVLVGIGLSMDAFAVSICKGLSMKKIILKKAFIIALYFGIFQALMPFIGYLLGISFQALISSIDHWIAFFLLSIIGTKMIAETFEHGNNSFDDKTDFKTMLLLAIATSIDALAVGITFACLKVSILISILIIGVITFFICFFGVNIGSLFGEKFGKKAEFLGGIILIVIGLKILLEHLGILL